MTTGNFFYIACKTSVEYRSHCDRSSVNHILNSGYKGFHEYVSSEHRVLMMFEDAKIIQFNGFET
jgi:hypothetical protein